MTNETLGSAPESSEPLISLERKQFVIKRALELETAWRNLHNQPAFEAEVNIRREIMPASTTTEVIERGLHAVREEAVRLAAMLLVSACESDSVPELIQKPYEPVSLGSGYFLLNK